MKADTLFNKVVYIIAILTIGIITLLPILDAVFRYAFTIGISGSSRYVVYAVILLTFIASIITTERGEHLSLFSVQDNQSKVLQDITQNLSAFVSSMITVTLLFGSISQVVSVSLEEMVGIFPLKYLLLSMPLGYAFILYYIIFPKKSSKTKTLFALLGLIPAIFLCIPEVLFWCSQALEWTRPHIKEVALLYEPIQNVLFWPLLALILIGGFSGTPIFISLGGIAILFYTNSYAHELYRAEAVVNAAHQLFIESESSISAIPLLTLSGILLSHGKSGQRLVDLFNSLFGSLPYGLIIVAVIVSTFFTTFTGASGVTILALGGLLSYILIESAHCDKDFSYGLLTGSGSLGLLFPPSLATILYGMVAGVDPIQMFVAGFIPQILVVLAVCVTGILVAKKKATKPLIIPFSLKKSLIAIKNAGFELFLPISIILFWMFGLMTLQETGPYVLIYVLVVEVFFLREISLKELPQIIIKALGIVGGAMIILISAKGLSQLVIDKGITDFLSAWLPSVVSNPLVFLLIVNALLLIVGCFMDILSATIVVAPFIVAVGANYGINPYHLGVIFIINMSIGFLTPPVGMNLFLASYTFKEPVTKMYKLVLPFFLAQLAVLLIITYVPFLSTMFIK